MEQEFITQRTNESEGPHGAFYNEHIKPVMQTIYDQCKEQGINFIASFDLGVVEDNGDTKMHHLCTSTVLDAERTDVPRTLSYCLEVLLGKRKMMPSFEELIEKAIAQSKEGQGGDPAQGD